MWNQWQYHVTNVEENGRIPAVQPPNWQILNSHRTQSSLYNVDRLAAPDLTVSKVRINSQSCPSKAGITARIGNGGSLHVASGMVVNFFLGDPAAGGTPIGTAFTSRALYPGEFEDVTLEWNTPGTGQIFVTVNDPPAKTRTPSINLSLLPNTWAQTSGMDAINNVKFNLGAYYGIDGLSNTYWSDAGTVSTGLSFFEVRFPFPVNASSVTIANDGVTTTGFLAGTLAFSNGDSVPITLDDNGEGSVSFPEEQGITWVRLTASSTKSAGASISEFVVGGFYAEPPFVINEGEGRLVNNKASSALDLSPCDPGVNRSPAIISAPPITAQTGSLTAIRRRRKILMEMH